MGLPGLKGKLFGRKGSSNSTPKKTEDGRDQWGSRTSYVLASMGGAVGFGNLLRYPSQVFNNNGLQWFIPYLMSICLLAIPVLVLEVSIGQAFRGGSVVAYNSMNRNTRGLGLGMVWVGYLVCVYYVPMLGYVLRYFEESFKKNLPWVGRVEEFYHEDVLQDVGPQGGSFYPDGSVASYASYSDVSIIPKLAAWNLFSWAVVLACLVKGVATTGKVVYFTMGLPIVVLFILVGRGASLPNAGRGICLFWCEFNADQLAAGKIWQAASGQVFYSTGVGFGYFTAYASYNSKMANAVADSVIICCSNAAFETIAAFAAFGTVGFLGMTPEVVGEVSSFSLGFLSYPAALAQLPGAQFWSVLFFFTLFLLGISSSFAMLDAAITMIYDSGWAQKYSRVWFSTGIVIFSFLLSLMYCTRAGFWILDAIDTHTNNVALLWVVWGECFCSTVLYRWRDVTGQVGPAAWFVHVGGYLLASIIGLSIAHMVDPGVGAGVGFAVYFIGVAVSIIIAKTPDSPAPRFWGKNAVLSKLWWMGFYSGNQLRRDLNVTVAPPGSGNWEIPVYWAPILRYFSAPVLSIIFSFAYPAFLKPSNERLYDPLHIFSFVVAHIVVASVIFIAIVPATLNFLIPGNRRDEGRRAYAPQVLCGLDDIRVSEGVEAGGSDSRTSDSDNEKHDKAYGYDDKNVKRNESLQPVL